MNSSWFAHVHGWINRRDTMKQLFVPVLVVAALAVGACGSDGKTLAGAVETTSTSVPATTTTLAPTHTINGTLTLLGTERWTTDACSGRGGYDDINPAAQVTVKDVSGSVLGVGHLGAGHSKTRADMGLPAAHDPNATDAELAAIRMWCVFNWTIADVPDAAFYEVEVAHRGGTVYGRADVEARGWRVESTLGR